MHRNLRNSEASTGGGSRELLPNRLLEPTGLSGGEARHQRDAAEEFRQAKGALAIVPAQRPALVDREHELAMITHHRIAEYTNADHFTQLEDPGSDPAAPERPRRVIQRAPKGRAEAGL